jgi:transcriptional antiterminator
VIILAIDLLETIIPKITHFLCNENLVTERTDYKSLLEIYAEITELISNRQIAKVLFTLFFLEYSNNYELAKFLREHKYTITYYMQRLEGLKVVKRLHKKSKNYNIVQSFWNEKYTTSHKDSRFFSISDSFKPIVQDLYEVWEGYLKVFEVESIARRQRQWQDHKQIVENQLKYMRQREQESLGTCIHCGKLIPPNARDSKYYSKFPAGWVCHECLMSTPAGQRVEWMKKESSK